MVTLLGLGKNGGGAREMLAWDKVPIVEPFVIQDTVVDRLSHIEMRNGRMRFTFVSHEEIDGIRVGVVAVRVVLGKRAVIIAAKEALLAALGLSKLMVKRKPVVLH